MDNLKKSIQKFYGDFGAASIANIGLRYYNEKHKLVIIRIPHGPHRFVTSVLPLLTKVTKSDGQDFVNIDSVVFLF